MAAAIGMIPATVAAGLHFWKRDNLLASLAMAFGVLAGLVQALGLIRWVILVPGLAAAYVAPGATEIDKAMAASVFDTTNLYLGLGVGEHLGYLFTGIWTLLVSALLFADRRVLSVTGFALSLAVMAGMLEPFGVPMAATINAISATMVTSRYGTNFRSTPMCMKFFTTRYAFTMAIPNAVMSVTMESLDSSFS